MSKKTKPVRTPIIEAPPAEAAISDLVFRTPVPATPVARYSPPPSPGPGVVAAALQQEGIDRARAAAAQATPSPAREKAQEALSAPASAPASLPTPVGLPAQEKAVPPQVQYDAPVQRNFQYAWYVVRLNAAGWPAIPILAPDEEAAVIAYADHCGIHTTGLTLNKFAVAYKYWVSPENAENCIPETTERDIELSGNVGFLFTPHPDDEKEGAYPWQVQEPNP